MSNFLIDEETDLLAAEFVLGTLDTEERARAHSTLKTDPAFIAMVRIWERRFGELHLMVEPVDPDPKLWPRIKSSVASMGSAGAGEQSPDLSGHSAVVSEAVKPAEGAAVTPPQGAAAEGGTPAQTSPGEQAASPAEAAPPATLPPAPDLVVPTAQATPGPDASALEAIIRSELASPSPTKAAEKPAEKAAEVVADRQPARQRQAATEVVRSRDRWRVFGMLMVLVAAGFAALVAAWRFMPDRVPARLRPTELMLSIGIGTTPPAAPARTAPPPTSGFDE